MFTVLDVASLEKISLLTLDGYVFVKPCFCGSEDMYVAVTEYMRYM